MARQRFSIQEVAVALENAHGIPADAARLLGCHTLTVRNYIKRYPELAEVQKQEQEAVGDALEATAIARALNQNDKDGARILTFLLETRFKDRGYSRRLNVSIPHEDIERFERAIRGMGLDPTAVMRTVVSEAEAETRSAHVQAIAITGRRVGNDTTPDDANGRPRAR